ncbi:MAG: HEAT repeat domain-containing protein [Planctomycetota bacterium]
MKAPQPLLPFVLLLACAAPVLGQGSDRLILPTDPEAETSLKRLEELGRRGQWDQVVLGLDRLLTDGGAKLFAAKDGYVSVRSEARRRLRALTGQGRDAYLLIHGEEAKQLFAIGRRSPRPDPFERVLAEHPATPEVEAARRLLANRYIERGNPDAALLHLEALLATLPTGPERDEVLRLHVLALIHAGRGGEARNALDELQDPRFQAFRQEASAWLERFAVPLPAAPSAPGALAWRREVFGYYETKQGGTQAWSRPESDGTTVYLHDGSHALAIELATGKLRWRTPLHEIDAFHRPEGLCPLACGGGVVVCLERDHVTGIDQASGRALWSERLSRLQRAAGIDFDASFADAAAPAVIGEVAVLPLVTAHRDREVHLIAVELTSGRFAWSVFLAAETGGELPEPALTAGPGRVFAATGHGAVAAVDAHGEVLWLRSYASTRDRRGGRRGPAGFPFPMPREGQPQQPARRREPSTMALVGRDLWLAAADGRGFLALDARTGERRGGVDAKGARIVGALAHGVIGTSEGKVLAVDRAGAKELLTLPKPDDAYMAAAETAAGPRLFVAAGGELQVLDLAGGAPQRFALQDEPGNLLVAGGRLVSTAPRGVTAYGEGAAAGPTFATGDAALAALGDPRYPVRAAASIALLTSETMVPRDQLVAAAKDQDPEVALRAAIALGELDRAARLVRWGPLIKSDWAAKIPDLLNRLTHPNPEVRLQALVDLGAIDDPGVLALMVDLMRDQDSRVAFYAAGVLLEKKDRRGIELLARALRGELPAQDRKKAAELLIKNGTAEDVPILVAALKDPEPEVRALAVAGAMEKSEGRALGEVEPLLGDPEPSVRLAVIKSLAFAVGQDARAARLLARAVQDKDDQIRLVAVKALAEKPTPAGLRVLCLALGDKVRETAFTAAQAINRALQRKGMSDVERREMIDPVGLERGARDPEDFNRNYVAQIAMRYLDAQGQLSIEAMARLLGDRRRQIVTLKIGGRGWGDFLLQQVQGAQLTKAEVAAIGSLTLSEDPNERLHGYQFLADARGGPGRTTLLAQGLADEHPTIRQDVGDWLSPQDPAKPSLLDDAALETVLKVATASERKEGREAAQRLLETAPNDRVVPGLIRLVGRADLALESWAFAGRTLAVLAKGKASFDEKGDRSLQSQRFREWWTGAEHPAGEVDELVQKLGSKNPSDRFQAARKAAEVPTERVRKALVASLVGEELGWVLKEKLAALVKLSGETHGYDPSMRGTAELKAVAERFVKAERERGARRPGTVPR